ncbi:hypothetical protein LAZ67_1008055 [Cordylochernes scorpioides]|uniref:Uncharacterized protein n=1 Tax=Cordylochernes scorpioides TaxID=51811 RepID=A0ABY6JZP8_9ARAC|nr:hypothetical protein LAZ67_1008055 [Cordylochernes scorpioides]
MEVESSDATGDGSVKRPRISEPPCNLEFNQLKVIHQKVTKKMADVAKSNGMTPEQLQPMLSLVEWALKGTEDIIFDVYKGINHGKENQLPKEKLYTNVVAKPNTTRPTPPPIKQLIKPASKNFAAAYESHVVIKSSNPSTDSREILREIQKADSSILNSPEVAASVNGKGRLVIHTKTTQGASTLAARLQANNNIPKSLNCTERPTIYPRYCLFGVESSTTNDMIVGSLQNNDYIKILPGKRHIKVAHRPKDNPHGYTTVFLEVDDQTANFLEHRVLELFTIAIEQEVDAILLQELPKNFKWPDSSFDTFIPNENNAPSGLVIRSNLNAIPLSSPDSNISTALIRLGNQAVVLASAYWHNSVPDLSFLPTLESAINIGSFSCILGMDANAHSPTWGIGATRDARGASLEDSASLMGLQFLGSPNHYTWSNGSLRSSIDVTLASSSLAIHATRSCLQEMAFSDHLPILTNFDDIISTEPICSWVETSCLEETFTAFIGSSLHHVTSRLQTAFTPGDIDEVVTLLTTCLQEACNVSMRKKSKSPRPSRPWWNKELSKLRNIVVALRRCYQSTSFYIRSFFKGLYRACHNKLKAAIRREKHLSWITLCQEVSSAAWSSIHRYISKGRRGSLGPPLLKHSDGTPLTPEETCHEVLQHYFPTDWTAPPPSIDWLQSYNQEPAFTVSEVLRAIRRCGRRKSPGPDRLGIRCLLLGGSTLHKTLSQIFTKCLRLGHFPTPWKSGLLVLIPKQNSSSSNQLEKYRPITLLNTLAKVLERCILARLQWIADYQGWFSPQQFGFLPGRSAEMALDSINNNISEGLQHWRKTLAIGLDISHAFDTVQRHTIIQGLRDLNCPEELIQLSASFLRGRQRPPPAPHGEKTTPDMATPPLSPRFIDERWREAHDIIDALGREPYSEHLSELRLSEGDITDAIICPEDREPLLRRLSTRRVDRIKIMELNQDSEMELNQDPIGVKSDGPTETMERRQEARENEGAGERQEVIGRETTAPLADAVNQLSTLLTRVKISDGAESAISPFDGTYSATQFFQTFDRKMEDASMEEQEKLLRLPNYLVRQPLELFRKLRLADRSYFQVRQILLDLYPESSEASFAKYFAMKLTGQANLETYYREKTAMGLQLGLPQEVILETLTEGLPFNDQRLVRVVPPENLGEWFRLVQRIHGPSVPATRSREDQPPTMSGPYHSTSRRPESSTEALRAFRSFRDIRSGKGPMSCYSLKRLIKSLEETESLEAKPRSGRPSTCKSVAVTVLQNAEAIETFPRMEKTISRRLVANGLHSCRPLRRLPLTPPNRRQRLEWCRARSKWMTEWHRVVFSDESRFCLSSDSRRVRVWRRRGERSNPAAIVERPTVRQRGIMVWGAIAYDSRSPLLRIQGTMTAQRYVDDVLRPVTLPYLQGVPNALYQQDNARPHTARISQQALQDVQMLPWPPYSPDLSPIEHVWDIIGRRLHALPQPRSEDELWQMVEREWRAIPQDAIRTLIDSLPRRVAACIAVRGGPTCY